MAPSRGHTRLWPFVALLGVIAGLLSATALPAAAADTPVPTTLTLTAPESAFVDDTVTLNVTLLAENLAPVVGAQVQVGREQGEGWSPEGTVTTGQDGAAALEVTVEPKKVGNTFLATFDGDPAHASSASVETTFSVTRRATEVMLSGPDTIVDETTVGLRVSWRTSNGSPIAEAVRVMQREPGGAWRRYETVRLSSNGKATLEVGPRVTTRWKVIAPGTDHVRRDVSNVLRLKNLPPLAAVRLPARAPTPRVKLPRQKRAVGEGPNAVVSRIPNGVWRSMVGRSWHRGCPVGRTGLRLIRINYWGYDGYRYRGELVVNRAVAGRAAAVFSDVYRGGYRIRALFRVDRFGWSSRVNGANDYRSMAAGNTSGFNCRWVVGRPGVLSPHASGRSLDINTWENPYRSPQGLLPNAWWQSHSHPLLAWRSRSHPVVAILRSHGFSWTYGLDDTQHFDG